MTIIEVLWWIFGIIGMISISLLILAAGGLLRDLCISANSIARSLERIAEHAEAFIDGDCDCDCDCDCAARFEPAEGADVGESSDDALDELDDELSGGGDEPDFDKWRRGKK